jgi:hypothetical protein
VGAVFKELQNEKKPPVEKAAVRGVDAGRLLIRTIMHKPFDAG